MGNQALTWKNVTGANTGGIFNAMTRNNALQQKAFQGVADAFTGQADRQIAAEDRELEAADRLFKREGDLLQRSLTEQKIAAGAYDASNQEADRKMKVATYNLGLNKGNAAIAASNASTAISKLTARQKEQAFDKTIIDESNKADATQWIQDHRSQNSDGSYTYNADDMMQDIPAELIPYVTKGLGEYQAMDDFTGVKAATQKVNAEDTKRQKEHINKLALEEQKGTTKLANILEKEKAKAMYSGNGKGKAEVNVGEDGSRWTTGGEYDQNRGATAATELAIKNALPNQNISKGDMKRMIKNVDRAYQAEYGNAWFNTGFDEEKLAKFLPTVLQEQVLIQAARNKNK